MLNNRIVNVRFFLIMLMTGTLYTSTAMAQDKWDRVLNLKGMWKFSIGDKALWGEKYFNDNKWEDILVPSKWEDEGFNGYNGYAWYRKTFSGTELVSVKDAGLHLLLGHIDDVDEVYFNGTKIGGSGSFPPRFHTAYNAFRSYFIPKELIDLNGRNVIAVRVYDSEIEGGIVSGDVGIYTNRGDRGLTINLRGVWDFKLGRERYNSVSESSLTSLTKDGWTDIIVPSIWEKQGFDDYDGSAWYKKTFTIPKEMVGDDVVLLLGKIDDSDKVFLNGKLIGSTEQRHDKLRMYHIQSSQFKPGENTLIVFVDDTGGAGGMWEGPVGLMKQSEFTRYIRWK
jgi:beta-galactosidase/beta-glucuronidase